LADLINPHDRFFKEALSQHDTAVDFLRYYLPADVTALLDLSTIELIKDSFVDEALHEHFSDLLYAVGLGEGQGIYVYVLFEHKSYTDKLTALQVLRYMVRVWDYGLRQEARLWPILPVVVYHGPVGWHIPLDFHSLFQVPEPVKRFVPAFQYWLCDLSTFSDDELKGDVALRAAFLLLKHIFDPDLHERLPDIASLWYNLAQQPTALGYVEAMLRYLATASDRITERDLREAIEAVIPDGDRMMMTIAQRWIDQGLQQGLQQGQQQGLRLGLVQGITLGLDLKFGAEGLRLLPEIRKIEDIDVLTAIQEALKTVKTIDELRRVYLA
jgi:predicted transposase/invertase (TIGR01784 family)